MPKNRIYKNFCDHIKTPEKISERFQNEFKIILNSHPRTQSQVVSKQLSHRRYAQLSLLKYVDDSYVFFVFFCYNDFIHIQEVLILSSIRTILYCLPVDASTKNRFSSIQTNCHCPIIKVSTKIRQSLFV